MARTARAPPSSHGTGLEAPKSDTAGDASASGSQKRGRGRPPKSKSDSQNAAAVATGSGGAGRPRRSSTVRATESQVTTGEGSRKKRGRPTKDDVAPPAVKRGRKPRSEQVAKKTVGRPKKATDGASGQGAADPRELKKQVVLLQKKVKQAADKLKIAVSAIEEVQQIAAGI